MNNTETHEKNLMDYFQTLRNQRWLIIGLVAVSVLATAVLSFFSPKIYRATAVIMPSSQVKQQNNMSALASEFGISYSRSSNVSEIVSLLKSNILMERVIKKYDLLPVLFDSTPKGKGEKRSLWEGIRFLKNTAYRVSSNRREGIIEVSVELSNPKSAASVLTNILNELTDYMSSEAKRVANTNKTYLESLIKKNSDPLIKQKIYSLIAQQVEVSMMAEVKENFAFKVLDPPRVPDRKIKPHIRSNVMLSFILSLFAGVLLAFSVEYIKEARGRSTKE